MAKSWYVDLLAFALIGIWMAWTYSTIQMHGPSLALVVGAVVIAAVGLLTIYGQRLEYLRVGNTIELGMRTPKRDDEETETERERYR